ncbi:hypothetical protein [Lactiplantibacillus pentosus]|uniref:hypothetical protein n=1 Tax=Lactiplantibacillus pentosus TaxID=1589 RepID=UPI003D2F1EB3
MDENKNHPDLQNQSEAYYQKKNQLRYVRNVVKVENVSLIRVIIKAPSNIYNPDFKQNVGLWEQYWTEDGEKVMERQINIEDLSSDKATFS